MKALKVHILLSVLLLILRENAVVQVSAQRTDFPHKLSFHEIDNDNNNNSSSRQHRQTSSLDANNNNRRRTEDDLSDLQEWLNNKVETSDRIVGLSTFLVANFDDDDTEIKTLTSGKAVLSSFYDLITRKGISTTPKDVTDDTTFLVASVSKLITWTALNILLDNDKFDIDDDVNDALPFDFKNKKFPNIPVTYRHLYSHTSGLIDTWEYKFGNDCPTDNPMEPYPQSLIKAVRMNTKLKKHWSNNKPGSKYLYSNFATALAAVLVEQHAGIPFVEFTQRYIFDPLQMTSTSWIRPTNGNAAELYKLYNKKGYEYKTDYGGYCFIDYPSGQLWTTASDLAKFASAMLRRGHLNFNTDMGADCLYSQVTGDLVYQQISPSTGNGDSAYGWFVGTPGYEDGAGHDGGEFGASADFYIHLKENVGAGFLANGSFSYDEYVSTIEELMDKAKSIGSITDTYDPSNPKACTTTYSVDPPNNCEDSTRTFKYSRKDWTCDDIASHNKKETYCNAKNQKIATHCPLTCNKCDKHKCKDSKANFYLVNGKVNQCKWIEKKSNRCGKIGDDLTCRKTCGDCE